MKYTTKAIDAVTAFVIWLCIVLLLAIAIMAAQGVARGQILPPAATPAFAPTPTALVTPTPKGWGDYSVYLPAVFGVQEATPTPRGY